METQRLARKFDDSRDSVQELARAHFTCSERIRLGLDQNPGQTWWEIALVGIAWTACIFFVSMLRNQYETIEITKELEKYSFIFAIYTTMLIFIAKVEKYNLKTLILKRDPKMIICISFFLLTFLNTGLIFLANFTSDQRWVLTISFGLVLIFLGNSENMFLRKIHNFQREILALQHQTCEI